MRRKSLLTSLSVAAMLSFAPLLSAQSFAEYKWSSEMAPAPEVSAEFANAPAIIYKYEVYNSGVFTGEMPFIEQMSTYRESKHIKIQSEEALEDYKQIIVPRFTGQIADYVNLKEYDMRIRKKSGEIIDLDIKKLPIVTPKEGDEYYKQRDEVYIYEVPSLEIGDEIEVVYTIESKYVDPGRTVVLSQEYPIIHAKYTIAVPRTVSIKGIVNHMPPVTLSKNADQNIYAWEVKNLKAIPEANTAGTTIAYTNGIPNFEYEIDFSSLYAGEILKQNNFRDIVVQYNMDYLRLTKNTSKKVGELFNAIFKDIENDNLARFIALNEYITKKLQIVPTKSLKKDSGVEDYLTLNQADYAGALKIYLEFFRRYNIQHYIGFVKDRYSGPLNLGFVSSTQISDYYLVAKINDVFLPVSATGHIMELPYNHHGVDFYLVDKTNITNENLTTINFGEHVYLADPQENKQLSKYVFNINTSNNTAKIESTNNLFGQYSTLGRLGYVNASKKDSLVQTIEKSLKNNFKDKTISVISANIETHESNAPYDFTVKTQFDFTNLFKQTADGFSLDLSEWLSHNIQSVSNPENRTLDYYLPYVGTEVMDLVFAFDKPIKEVNISELPTKVDTKYGMYEMRAVKLNDKTLHLQSRYVTKYPNEVTVDTKAEDLLRIPAAEAKLLDEANQAFNKVRKKNLVVKF